MPRTLILGAIEGYRFEQIRHFFTSLRATSFDGQIVLFHRRIDEPTLDELRRLGIRLIPLAPRGLRNPFTGRRFQGEGALGPILQGMAALVRSLPLPAGRRESLQARFAERFYHIANARFVLACEYLAQHRASFDTVMLTDVRDVYFQGDPFTHPAAHELCTFYEDSSITLRTNRNYREWLAAACGEAFVQQHLDSPLACCAVTLGPVEPMLAYLRQMSDSLQIQSGSEPFRFGLDSAVHNRLLAQKKLPALRALAPFEGPVLHLGGIPASRLGDDPLAALRDTTGRPIALIHQFDRHPALAARFCPPAE